MSAVQWVFEDRDRASGVLLVVIALLVLVGHKLLEVLSFRKDAREQELEADQDQAIALTTEVVVIAPEPTRVLPRIPMQRVTNDEDLLGGGLR